MPELVESWQRLGTVGRLATFPARSRVARCRGDRVGEASRLGPRLQAGGAAGGRVAAVVEHVHRRQESLVQDHWEFSKAERVLLPTAQLPCRCIRNSQ